MEAFLGFVFLLAVIVGIRSLWKSLNGFFSSNSSIQGQNYEENSSKSKCRWCKRHYKQERVLGLIKPYYNDYCSPKCYDEHKKSMDRK